MPKLFISILCLFTISLGLLQLRQQRLNYRFEINRLHDRIESSQAKLWNQQLKIATVTTPEALVKQQVPSQLQGGSEGVVPTSLPAPQDRRWLDSRVIP